MMDAGSVLNRGHNRRAEVRRIASEIVGLARRQGSDWPRPAWTRWPGEFHCRRGGILQVRSVRHEHALGFWPYARGWRFGSVRLQAFGNSEGASDCGIWAPAHCW